VSVQLDSCIRLKENLKIPKW